MIRAVVARVIAGLVLILLLTLMTFAIWSIIPVDPAIYLNPNATPEQRAAIRHELGFDRPLPEQWGSYVWRLGTEADFGNTLSAVPQPVRPILTSALGPTLSLVLGGFALMLLLAVPLGVLCARRAGSALDRAILTFSVLGLVLHPFIVGLVLRQVFSGSLGLAPAGGYCPIRGEAPVFTDGFRSSSCGGLLDWTHHMWLPWMTFALFFLPLYVRFVRSHVLEQLGQLYVVTARAKGVPERRLVRGHVAQNASGPIVAMVAVDVAAIVTTAIYVETIFGLPGIGRIVASSLSGGSGYDLKLILGVVVLVAIAIMLLNLFADLIIRALDPRVRLGRASD
ncbi:MAG: ABC transporter permease [Gaiella sp.]|nr:ABC transporter permease [Gaiella sp.]